MIVFAEIPPPRRWTKIVLFPTQSGRSLNVFSAIFPVQKPWLFSRNLVTRVSLADALAVAQPWTSRCLQNFELPIPLQIVHLPMHLGESMENS